MTTSAHNIVVVGGGPVGMVVAHALTKAGIDFVLLESRPSIVQPVGASLVLSPIGLRALSQFGVMPAIEKVSAILSICKRFDHQGRTIGDIELFSYLRQNHGYASRIISRQNLMQILLDSLPAEAQSKLLLDKKVSGIRKTKDGVVVECTDGTLYEGSLVIGSDGAYSSVRKYMRTMDDEPDAQEPSSPTAEQEEAEDKELLPYLTTYRCFWMRFPRLPGIMPGDVTEAHGPQATTQYFANEDTAIVAVYERLPQPTRRPPRRYSDADEAALVARWGHLPLHDNHSHTRGAILTLAEAYVHATQTGFINLEEGVAADWSRAGRAVLVGDAAHKFTPSTGAGCNNGIIDVVVLVNKLNKIFASAAATTSGSVAVPKDELATAFREYQDARFNVVTLGCSLSGRATANASWATPWDKLLDLYVLSWNTVVKLFLGWAAKKTVLTPVFDFIAGEDKVVGNYPWVHAMPKKKLL
ncbi:hypothetical protein PG989_000394 [Apiospora arundinis]